jgi:dienelactone hydrolase
MFATLLVPSLALASAGVQALFSLDTPSGAPFPSDRFTVRDRSQNTRLRINLPKPDCSILVSDCQDIDVLNTLDGFNLQPRLSIPFSGPIDVTTVSSETVLLIKLGDARRRGHRDDDDDDDDGDRDGRSHRPDKIGINQIVWDVATNTLHVESDKLLDQHTRYALIVTRDVKDSNGRSVGASKEFEHFRHRHHHGFQSYRKALLKGLDRARAAGFHHKEIVAASVFTTMSVTAGLEQIREQIRAAAPPAPADFLLGEPNRTVRTTFALDMVQTMRVDEQVGTAPTFAAFIPRLAQLRLVPGAVGTVAFGSYRSHVYLDPGRFIPQVGTRTGTPIVRGEEEVFFNLFLPAGPTPGRGWPVAIVLPGCCEDQSKNAGPFSVAATLANHGIAAIAINGSGQGHGPLGTFTVRLASGAAITFPAGGRSLDVDGDGTIGPGEGREAPSPRRLLLNRDAHRQTVADLMQLVRVLEEGVDADGDGVRDLDPDRIYYLGMSAGAFTGVPFAALEPAVRAAVLNTPGGLVGERLRRSRGFRFTPGDLLASRVPSLLNPPGVTSLDGLSVPGPHFNENLPHRDGLPLGVGLADGTSHTVQSPVVNAVPGAMAIQQVLERVEWAHMLADAAAFAPYLRKAPLASRDERPVIVLFAKGDQQVPNPATTAILRAGDLADRAIYYRTDQAVNAYGAGPAGAPPTPPPGVEKDGHIFLNRQNSPTRTAIARAAQEQVAVFFASDGQTVIDPNPVLEDLLKQVGVSPPPEPLFEAPIAGPLPEDLNFIP